VLRAAGETETMQENIQDWLQLDEGERPWISASDRGIHYCGGIVFIYLFSSAQPILLNFPFICFLEVSLH
jgi:hypothetical protein